MNATWKAAIGVIVIFILGWAGGAVSTLIVVRHKALAALQGNPEAIAIILERRTTRDLGLNADQKQQLHALFVQNLRQRMELQKQVQPQVKALNGQTLHQIDALLTPDQQQRFHENLVLFKSRFGRNPFNVGGEEKAAPPIGTAATTNAPATTPPAGSQ